MVKVRVAPGSNMKEGWLDIRFWSVVKLWLVGWVSFYVLAFGFMVSFFLGIRMFIILSDFFRWGLV